MVDQMADSSATTTSVLADKVEPTVSAGSPSKQPIPTVQAHQQQPRPGQVNDSKVLKLKGLPYSTSENDIHNFFSGFQLTDVAFVYEPDGRPSGLVSGTYTIVTELLGRSMPAWPSMMQPVCATQLLARCGADIARGARIVKLWLNL
jgi:hypothetical protein